LGVSSLFFILAECDNTQPQNRSLLNTFYISHYQLERKSGISPYGVKANLVVQDNTQK